MRKYEKELKVFGSKKAALAALPKDRRYKTGLYCTGKYNKVPNKLDYKGFFNIVALYKSYGRDEEGSYIRLRYVEEI